MTVCDVNNALTSSWVLLTVCVCACPLSELSDVEPNIFLRPFLEVVRSEDTTGPITGLALTSVNKFLSYGLIGKTSCDVILWQYVEFHLHISILVCGPQVCSDPSIHTEHAADLTYLWCRSFFFVSELCQFHNLRSQSEELSSLVCRYSNHTLLAPPIRALLFARTITEGWKITDIVKNPLTLKGKKQKIFFEKQPCKTPPPPPPPKKKKNKKKKNQMCIFYFTV